jgi:hypothetical protein
MSDTLTKVQQSAASDRPGVTLNINGMGKQLAVALRNSNHIRCSGTLETVCGRVFLIRKNRKERQ